MNADSSPVLSYAQIARHEGCPISLDSRRTQKTTGDESEMNVLLAELRAAKPRPRSTMDMKKWLSIKPRNFGSDIIVT